ncbi:hypothetical protein B5K11_02285 [Rhizobium leguminosarum bv. trifolii]|nr:hypothetical protein B5K11_02285 [Rhizobium leguminosarum bv. trifolii]
MAFMGGSFGGGKGCGNYSLSQAQIKFSRRSNMKKATRGKRMAQFVDNVSSVMLGLVSSIWPRSLFARKTFIFRGLMRPA